MAKDIFHDTVKLALQKDGWTITHDPYRLRYGIADIYLQPAECPCRPGTGGTGMNAGQGIAIKRVG